MSAPDREPADLVVGECTPRFEAVARVFRENFEQRGEVGAAVCVYRKGVKVVDLWGGLADRERGLPWRRDTILCMMSVGKGMAALCVHRLIEQGKLVLDAPVATYWPGFGQAGKRGITVRQLLGGLAGLIYADATERGQTFDWAAMVAALERQAPEWPPGTQGAYHSATAPYLLGELVRQADGRSVGDYFRQEFAEPLGLDYALGVDDEQLGRVATLTALAENPTQNAMRDASTRMGRAWKAMPLDPEAHNSEAYRRSQARGHGAPRAVAKLFAALSCGGTIDGMQVFKPETVELMRSVQWDGTCGMTGREFVYGLGFLINNPMAYMGPNPRAFGHPGVGGALGFADPENRIAFGYAGNSLSTAPATGDRCPRLIDAVYASLS